MKDVYGDHYQYQPSLTEKQTDETNGLYGYTVGKVILHSMLRMATIMLLCHNKDIKNSTSSRGAVFVNQVY